MSNRIEAQTMYGTMTFEPREKYGAFYEVDDPIPSGTVGRLYIPMNNDGTPDLANLGEIEVSYEDA